MSANTAPFNLQRGPVVKADPGNGKTLAVDRNPCVFNLISAGAETRTLSRPEKQGSIVMIYCQTYVGNITLTVTGNYDTNGDSTFTFSAANQWVMFMAVSDGTNFRWQLISHYGISNIDPTAGGNLAGLTATAAELNRSSKLSTREVAAGGAALTVTLALHDGRTILLDQATGVAVTLPAMTGSGARYRFVCSVATSGGSHVITATAAHLFGGIFMGTDTTVTTLFTAVAAENVAGSTVITLNGSTTGGKKGDWFEIEDVATSIGIVRGMLVGTGTEATPFS